MITLGEEVFGYSEEEYFDDLPLEAQKILLDDLKAKHDFFLKKYTANSGIKGGRPVKNSDEFLEEVLQKISEIMETEEYSDRRDPREVDMTAYVIYIEQVLNMPKAKLISAESNIRHTEASIWDAAKALKQAVHRYKNRK